jgi:hypothetical protein
MQLKPKKGKGNEKEKKEILVCLFYSHEKIITKKIVCNTKYCDKVNNNRIRHVLTLFK